VSEIRAQTLHVHKADNVRVALQNLAAGTAIEHNGETLVLAEAIARKHKFSLEALQPNDVVIMYGITVGRAKVSIPAGALISTANVSHSTDSTKPTSTMSAWVAPQVNEAEYPTFEGFHRPDGQVGTANIWLVVPLVFCQNRNIEVLRQCVADALGEDPYRHYKRMAHALLNGEQANLADEPAARERLFPNVDGVRFLSHAQGCGGTDDDAQALCELIAGYIVHPNVAGATILSLGCQKSQIDMLRDAIKKRDPQGMRPVHYIEQQAVLSTEELIRTALETIFNGMAEANRLERKPAPLSKLCIGVECGGSDGFSGLSANPVVGSVVDRLVTLGGAGVLAEFPELCGVEHELMARCRRAKTAERFQSLMLAYEAHAKAVGADFSMNPSPGNIRDGLITDAMKSAGAAKKGGDSPIVDVLDYTEPVTAAGLSLLCTPGNDVESTTALAGSGVNLMLFTTGLGTPTGNPVVPVIKVSSNSELALRMADIIDFDAGPVIRGEATISELGDALLRQCIDTASGRYETKASRLAQYDFIPWKRGVSL
jgi:altronate hydrolase